MGPSRAVLSARGVGRTYRTRAGDRVGLHAADLEIAPGEWVALLGPNGSGKSTLLSIAATATMPAQGEVTIAGVRVRRGWPARDRAVARSAIGVVFQSPSLDGLLTVAENLRVAAALVGLRGAAARDAVVSSLQRFGLEDRAGDRVGRLSGGLKRRADLARAMLGRPRVLVLDEPTTGLDPDARRDLFDLLERARLGDPPPAILLSTHLTDEADRADRVVLLDRGRIAAEGTPASLRASVGARSLSAGAGARSLLESLGLSPRALPGARVMASLSGVDVPRVAGALDAAGLAFSIGPPSLDDAYAAIVGRGLDDDDNRGTAS